MEFKHTSVLLEEVLEGLRIRPDGIYVDGTLGGGGHSFHISSRLTGGGHLIGIDQDEDALRAAQTRLAPFADRVSLIHDNYENMEHVVHDWFREHRESRVELRPEKAASGAGSTEIAGTEYAEFDGTGSPEPLESSGIEPTDPAESTDTEYAGTAGTVSPEPAESRGTKKFPDGFTEGFTEPNEGKVNGILLDLGVSSYQLDNPERGFSYRTDAPLDMRMDRSAALSAADILNTWSAQELTKILRDYGEEKMAARIAANIVKAREEGPLETTGQLVRIIEKSIPMKMRERGGNPCKRTFQAIRIACNRELEVLEDSLDSMIGLLAPGGRLCIITFHSLEDRIVKNAFRRNENPCVCPPEFPVCVCGRVSRGRVVTRKPILPGKEELEQNRRSASAKLRIFEKS